MKISTIEKLLEDQLKDIHSAETQLVKALCRVNIVFTSGPGSCVVIAATWFCS